MLRRSFNRRGRIAGGFAVGAVLLIGSVSPAVGAELGVETETFHSDAATITVVTQPSSVTDADLAPLAQMFGCKINVFNPHGSGHVKGTINVESRVTCDINAARIRLATELYRVSPYARWVGTPKVVKNKNNVTSNAAAPCSAGPATFTGRGIGTIEAPAGYVLKGPPTHYEDGNEIGVACGLALRGGSTSGMTSTETLEFTSIRADIAEGEQGTR
jgi:hypothetical protein